MPSLTPKHPHHRALDPDDEEAKYRLRTRDHTHDQSATRTIVKEGRDLPEGTKKGTVITANGPVWIVDIGGHLLQCIVSGTVDVPHKGTIVTVGDDVWVVDTQRTGADGEPEGTIVRVEERRTLLSRKAAGRERREQVVVANVDHLCIVVAFSEPAYHRRLIDRYLIAADKGDLVPMIVLNKVDLIPEEYVQDVLDDFAPYAEGLGIEVFFVSAGTGYGVEELVEALAGKSTLFSGPSGVGKSSLVNAIANAGQLTGEVNVRYDRGRHTTTSAIVIPLHNGGRVVDSPGIREFAIWELGLDELRWYYEEFTPFALHCKYNPCTHIHEPHCAVKKAVEDGLIDEDRYVSYLYLHEELSTTQIPR